MLKDISSIKITGVNFNGDKLPEHAEGAGR